MISDILVKYSVTPDGGTGTDKNAMHSYGPVYDYLFRPYENKKIDLLEVGVRGGWSIAAWKEFFPKANITGIDIEEPADIKVDGVEYIISNVRDIKTDKQYDIVIDDGSHKLRDMLYVAENFKLKVGGVMIIEDVRGLEKWYERIKSVSPYNAEYVDLRNVKGKNDDVLVVLRNYGCHK